MSNFWHRMGVVLLHKYSAQHDNRAISGENRDLFEVLNACKRDLTVTDRTVDDERNALVMVNRDIMVLKDR